jgi:hypothetical protein
MYLGITDSVEPRDLAKDAFEDMAGDGVERAYLERGDSVRNVTVNIEVETGPPLQELREQDGLKMIEMMRLIEAGDLPAKEATKLLNELLQERGNELINEEGRFQGAAMRFPMDIFHPILEQADTDEE